MLSQTWNKSVDVNIHSTLRVVTARITNLELLSRRSWSIALRLYLYGSCMYDGDIATIVDMMRSNSPERIHNSRTLGQSLICPGASRNCIDSHDVWTHRRGDSTCLNVSVVPTNLRVSSPLANLTDARPTPRFSSRVIPSWPRERKMRSSYKRISQALNSIAPRARVPVPRWKFRLSWSLARASPSCTGASARSRPPYVCTQVGYVCMDTSVRREGGCWNSCTVATTFSIRTISVSSRIHEPLEPPLHPRLVLAWKKSSRGESATTTTATVVRSNGCTVTRSRSVDRCSTIDRVAASWQRWV